MLNALVCPLASSHGRAEITVESSVLASGNSPRTSLIQRIRQPRSEHRTPQPASRTGDCYDAVRKTAAIDQHRVRPTASLKPRTGAPRSHAGDHAYSPRPVSITLIVRCYHRSRSDSNWFSVPMQECGDLVRRAGFGAISAQHNDSHDESWGGSCARERITNAVMKSAH